jgi:putative sterol carrier protein
LNKEGIMAIQQPKEWFETELSEKVKDDPSVVEGFDGVLDFKITGDGGGDWSVEIRDNVLNVQEGSHEKPDILVTMKAPDFVNFINGKLNGQMAFMTGKLKVKGNMQLAMKLNKLV